MGLGFRGLGLGVSMYNSHILRDSYAINPCFWFWGYLGSTIPGWSGGGIFTFEADGGLCLAGIHAYAEVDTENRGPSGYCFGHALSDQQRQWIKDAIGGPLKRAGKTGGAAGQSGGGGDT